MDELELKSILNAELSRAVGTLGDMLTTERRDAFKAYNADDDLGVLANVPEGRSKMVIPIVRNVIESMMPSFMRIFTAGDRLVVFEGVGPEDVESADQETDYVNHVVMQENNGFLILYTMFKDALLFKNGYVKSWWEDSEEEETESYENLTETQWIKLVKDPEVEVITHTARVSEEENVQPQAPSALAKFFGVGTALRAPAPKVHDVKLKRKTKRGRCRIMAVPPEEVLIAPRSTSIPDASFVAHKTRKRVSDLVADGHSFEELKTLPSYVEDGANLVRQRRFAGVEESVGLAAKIDETMREVTVHECYIRVDWDDDGIAELRSVLIAGNRADRILENEEFNGSRAPIYTVTPIIVTHRIEGVSAADLTIDLQILASAVWRNVLDNFNAANNLWVELPETAIGEDTVDDVLTSRPTRIVRTKVPGQMKVFQPPSIGQPGMLALEYITTQTEERTGVTRYNQGLDANSLNRTATGIQAIQAAAQQRIELIARVFAETGIKELFLGVHELLRKHQKQSRVFRLRNQWVDVDPRDWKKRNDLTVNVGLGTGNKDQMLGHLNNLMQIQREIVIFQKGVQGPLVTAKHLYNTISKIVENAGLKQPDLYVSDPTSPEATQGQQQPQQQAPDPKMIEIQARMAIDGKRLELDAQKMQADAQSEMAKGQVEQQQAAAANALKQMEIESNAALKREEMMLDAQLQREKVAAELAFERDKAMAELALKREIELARITEIKRDGQGAEATAS